METQGTAELKLGVNKKNVDNPSLPERNRKTTAFDFDEKVNLNLTGKVGDKVNNGDTVVVLEAMKMQNNIEAEATGTITSVAVSAGDSVMEGSVLVTIG